MTQERRPLRTRELSRFQRMAAWLIARRVRPNAISVLSIVFAGAAGLCLVAASTLDSITRALFLLAAAFVQLRLLANMLDGMVAVGSGDRSALGDVFNEVPDRIADTIILVAAGYSLGGSIVLGFAATIGAIFTAYLRAYGGVHGVQGLFLGPMAKPHRMAAVTAACLWAAVVPTDWPGGIAHGFGSMRFALWVITLGCVITCVRRLTRIVAVVGARS